MGKSIKKIFFILLLALSSLSVINAAPESLETCLNSMDVPLSQVEDYKRSCYLADIRNSLKIKDSSILPNLITRSHNIDFGLGQPLFSGLKRKRDKFISEYIDKNIGMVKEIQKENMRRFNLKTIMAPASTPKIIDKLKKIFNLTSIEGIVNNFKEKRLNECQVEHDNIINNCGSGGNPPTYSERQRCEADASKIINNCFKFSTEPTYLKNLQIQLSDVEDMLLQRISSASFINHDEISGFVDSFQNEAKNLDDKMSSLNRILSLDIGGKLGNLLNGDPIDTIEQMVASKSGISMTLVGVDSWREESDSRTKDNEMFNYRLSLSSKKVNNLCDLTKCLVYPSSKKYKQDGSPTEDYKSMCLDQNLTKEYLNNLVNQARKKLVRVMSKMVLKEILSRIGVDAIMSKVRNMLVCGAAATSKTISSAVNSASTFDVSSALTQAFSGAPKIQKTNEKMAKCLSQITDTKKQTISETEFGLIKCGGPLGHVYVASGAANVPFGCIRMQAKKQGGNYLLMDSKTAKAIDSCMSEGETSEWISNYEACTAVDGDFKYNNGFGADLNIGIGKLFNDLSSVFVGQCKGLLTPDRQSSFGAEISISINPIISNDSQGHHADFFEVKTKLMRASRSLFNAKVDASKYFPTKQMLCADKALSVLKKHSYYDDFLPCKILDPDLDPTLNAQTVPEIIVGNLLSGFQIQGLQSPPVHLLPSVIDLCKKSADYVTNKIKLEINNPNARDPSSTITMPNPPVIAKAISNVNKCSMFFNDLELVLPKSDVVLNNLVERKRFNDWISKQSSGSSYLDGQMLDDDLSKYKETLEMFKRRSDQEMFNICIKDDKISWNKKPTIIRIARNDFCKGYRISLFDRYYDEAENSFNFPITDRISREKADRYIYSQKKKYKDGQW